MTKFNYIIYHSRCYDGFTGLYLFLKTNKWEKNPYIYPDAPFATTVPPDIDGKNVISIDVAYKPEIVQEISQRANKFLFIDHHITIKDEIEKLKLADTTEIVYDNDKCGATLVWKYFFKRKKMPYFVSLIEDNDLGKWKNDDTKPFITALEVHYGLRPTFLNLKYWDNLLEESYLYDFIDTGKKYLTYKNYVIDTKKYELVKFPSKWYLDFNKNSKFELHQFTLALINTDDPAISLLGKKIAEECNCDGVVLYRYNFNYDIYTASLRSKDTDVGTIAKELGGGGHKLASGFSWNNKDGSFDKLFDRIDRIDKIN